MFILNKCTNIKCYNKLKRLWPALRLHKLVVPNQKCQNHDPNFFFIIFDDYPIFISSIQAMAISNKKLFKIFVTEPAT